jgi:hypothetical protein
MQVAYAFVLKTNATKTINVAFIISSGKTDLKTRVTGTNQNGIDQFRDSWAVRTTRQIKNNERF